MRNKFIYKENINYDDQQLSVWGKGDNKTLNLIKQLPIKGKWLNLAAGDGRYNNLILEKVDKVIAADIDKNALDKLRRNTPQELLSKLEIEVFNINKKFPFNDEYFDGIFCTGTLHLFPKERLVGIIEEINRTLKKDGMLLIDFATDIRRELPDGELVIKEGESKYHLKEARELLINLLGDYQLEIIESEVPEEEVILGDITYAFSCKFLLLKGKKLN